MPLSDGVARSCGMAADEAVAAERVVPDGGGRPAEPAEGAVREGGRRARSSWKREEGSARGESGVVAGASEAGETARAKGRGRGGEGRGRVAGMKRYART